MQNTYISKAKSPRKAMLRTLGFRLFQKRQEMCLTHQSMYLRTGIGPAILDKIEIGKGDVHWGDVLILLNFYERTVDFASLLKEESNLSSVNINE